MLQHQNKCNWGLSDRRGQVFHQMDVPGLTGRGKDPQNPVTAFLLHMWKCWIIKKGLAWWATALFEGSEEEVI